jgi:hypothetical protein
MVEVEKGIKNNVLFKRGKSFQIWIGKWMLEGMTRYTGQHIATAEGFGFQLFWII